MSTRKCDECQEISHVGDLIDRYGGIYRGLVQVCIDCYKAVQLEGEVIYQSLRVWRENTRQLN